MKFPFLYKNSFHTMSLTCVGGTLAGLSAATPASASWPVANDAIFIPFNLYEKLAGFALFSINGGTVSGNIDVGIYTIDGAKIISSGSTAQSGTSSAQIFNVTDFVLSPGLYYLACALNNATGTIFRANVPVSRVQVLGLAKMASAFPLPDTAVFASMTSGYLPMIGIETMMGVL